MGESYQSLRKALSLFDLLIGDEFQSKAKLAETLEIAPRTVKGYIDVFEEFAWPIERSRKGFKLSESGAAAGFTEDDLLLLAILLAHGSSTLPSKEFERISKKLVGLLPEPSVSKVKKLNDKVEQIGGRSGEIEILASVGRCLFDPHYQLVADYRKTEENEPQRRQLLPVKIRYQNGCCYIDCYDLEKGKERSFRLDRFVRAQLLKHESPLSCPAEQDASTHKWDFGAGEEIEVTIELSERLARWLQESPIHPSQNIVRIEDTWLATYKVRRLDFFVDWVMSLRGVKPLQPPPLIEAVQDRCRAFQETGGTLEVEWG